MTNALVGEFDDDFPSEVVRAHNLLKGGKKNCLLSGRLRELLNLSRLDYKNVESNVEML